MRRARLMLAFVTLVAGCAGLREPKGVERALRESPTDFLQKVAVGPLGDGTYVVGSNQRIDPAGENVLFNGRPVDLALSPDGKTLAVKYNAGIAFVDTASRKVRQLLTLKGGGNSFCGIVWSEDGSTVWNTATDGAMWPAQRNASGDFEWRNMIALPGPKGDPNSSPGGFTLDEAKGLAYVALSRNNSVGVLNLATRKIEGEIPVGVAPYTVRQIVGKAYVSNWGGRQPNQGDMTGPTSGSKIVVDPKTGIASTGSVTVIDLKTQRPIAEIAVGLHPSAMAVSPDKSRLYVANANSDSVSVIDTASNKVVETISTKPSSELPFGSAPVALAVSSDGATLYVANGGNNAMAVIDLKSRRVTGLVPTGWYPGSVLLAGNTLIVANTKGIGGRETENYVKEKEAGFGKKWHGYNSHDHAGTISFIPVPNSTELSDYTTRVAINMRLPRMHEFIHLASVHGKVTPVPTRPGETSPIKHVLYIIKENRTYDQVFGDMTQGKGDATLCQFGRDVTPNHHALAENFVLLDNFYCNGVLSADGHQWTDEGYVTDYLEKSFGDFSRSYPYDGDDALAYASSGFVWDYVLRAGLTFRDYGEFVKAKIEPSNATWADIYKDFTSGSRAVSIRAAAQLHTLEPYLCPRFIGFPGKMQDVYRASEFVRELHDFEQKGSLPNFMIMLLPNDHTQGTKPGVPTPRAAVADNDLALGQIVEAVSHSKFWPETAIFVVEDDPQGGLDHVDGRRTVALCVSPYTRRKVVESTFYNQSSMLRTIELILGLPPMNQFDMAATPMSECFQDTPDLTPYTVVPNVIPLDEMNPKLAELKGKQLYFAKKSMELPLDEVDEADEDTLNRILWHSTKGYDTPYPKLAQVRERKERGSEKKHDD